MAILYDLAAGDGRRFSPHCWRTRLALAHKNLLCETRPTRFTEIASIADGNQKTVPVLDDNGKIVGDSWAIAEYLEETYPDAPSLFGGPAGRALTVFVQGWAIATLQLGLLNLIVFDIWQSLSPEDKAYFRSSREKRLGRTLEEVQAGREERLPSFQKSLQPLRMLLAKQDWLGGNSPLYADYVAFAPFQWARMVSDLTLLEEGDIVGAWLERCLDLYDGLGRKALNP
jgi:glutathione S-transferase